MVGTRSGSQVFHDGVHDRVRRHGSRQALKDPGEALGFRSAALFKGGHRLAVDDHGQPDEDYQPRQDPVETGRHTGEQTEGRHQAQEEE